MGWRHFHHYIEAEIGETDLLHTLTERISRAEDLVVKRAGALAAVEERMRVLDPKAALVAPQAAASGRRQVVEKAVIAPARNLAEFEGKRYFKMLPVRQCRKAQTFAHAWRGQFKRGNCRCNSSHSSSLQGSYDSCQGASVRSGYRYQSGAK